MPRWVPQRRSSAWAVAAPVLLGAGYLPLLQQEASGSHCSPVLCTRGHPRTACRDDGHVGRAVWDQHGPALPPSPADLRRSAAVGTFGGGDRVVTPAESKAAFRQSTNKRLNAPVLGAGRANHSEETARPPLIASLFCVIFLALACVCALPLTCTCTRSLAHSPSLKHLNSSHFKARRQLFSTPLYSGLDNISITRGKFNELNLSRVSALARRAASAMPAGGQPGLGSAGTAGHPSLPGTAC